MILRIEQKLDLERHNNEQIKRGREGVTSEVCVHHA